jgi:hypothetical protein
MINLGSINITDMTGCEGKYKGCDVLAENILEVAKSISQNCATLYFDEKAYYKCEAQYAEPVWYAHTHTYTRTHTHTPSPFGQPPPTPTPTSQYFDSRYWVG